jgi:two-component system LytT family sensor kinase
MKFRQLLLIALCDIGIWALAGLFQASEFHRRAIVLGGFAPWKDILSFQMVVAFNWAFFTPFLVLLARTLPLRGEHRVRNAVALVAFLPYLAVIRAVWGAVVNRLGEFDRPDIDFVELSIGIRTHRYMAIIAAVFFITNLVDAHREAAERERQRVRAQTLLARTELDELRRRLQPRFAVRMLRHIASVLREEPRAADALIVELSAILRRSMARAEDEWIRLSDELEHLDRCLDLCRAGGRFAVSVRYIAGDDVLHGRVPALVLQPAIEQLVLDLTNGAGGSVEVLCEREGGLTRIEIASSLSTTTVIQVPMQEAAA